MALYKIPRCYSCKHFEKVRTCKAFPKGIPHSIITDELVHNRVIKGQKTTVVFEPINENMIIQYKRELKFNQEILNKKDNIIRTAKTLLTNHFQMIKNNHDDVIKGIVKIDSRRRSVITKDKIIFQNSKKESKIFTLDFDTELFTSLRKYLHAEMMINGYTDLILTIDCNYQIELNLTEEWQNRQEKLLEEYIKENNKIKALLYEEGFKAITEKEIKSKIKKIIAEENKNNPLSDQRITEIIKNEGFAVYRREIARLREQLKIKVARLRKMKTG